eukprot:scaffold2346_cov134-Pinguiococcus_pyrenoidosus.AAC.1
MSTKWRWPGPEASCDDVKWPSGLLEDGDVQQASCPRAFVRGGKAGSLASQKRHGPCSAGVQLGIG